jgi:hypothetical protein
MAGLVPAIHVLMSREPVKTWMPATSAGMTGGFCSLGTANDRRSVTIVADMLLSRIRRGGVTQGPAIPKQSGPQPPNQRQRWIEDIMLNGAEQGDNLNGIAYPPEDATTGRRLEGWLNSERGPLAAVPPRNSDARRTHSIKCANEDRLTLGSVFGSRLRRLNTNAIRSSCVQTGAART